jgi:hypothetical protein
MIQADSVHSTRPTSAPVIAPPFPHQRRWRSRRWHRSGTGDRFGHGRRRGTYGRPVVLWRRSNLRVDRRVPGGREGALVILDLLRELTVTFLHVDMPEPAKAADTTLLGDLSASAMEIPTPPRDHIPLGGVVRRGAGRSDGARPSLDCNSSRSVKTSA